MNQKVILLVEDDENDETLTRRSFEKSNIANELLVAVDGEEAINLLFAKEAENRISPDLVILDLRIPKVDGLEVLKRVRQDERTKMIPVVVLTSSDAEDDMKASYEAGANSFVRKPVDPLEFSDMVTNLGLYWLLLNIPGKETSPAYN